MKGSRFKVAFKSARGPAESITALVVQVLTLALFACKVENIAMCFPHPILVFWIPGQQQQPVRKKASCATGQI